MSIVGTAQPQVAADQHGLRRRRLHKQYSEYPAAIWGRNIMKSYGSRGNKINVLKNLNITVARGSIYGLLGPSGCGKTTLLRCVIGRLRVDSGHIIVLGDTPGSRGHKVPGSMVGYMPQETALFMDLTIGETLSYFGRLHGMTKEQINRRTDFLIQFLTLPKKNRMVGQLSGGQMRRVSFSVALLHEPEVLILDEPTVGVDPVLREKIWDHMINITTHTQNQTTTIIITTHYIEEAKQADRVGFMRNGRILAEEEPLNIIQQFQMTSLENVFLKLCQDDVEGTHEDLNPAQKTAVNTTTQTGQSVPIGFTDTDDEPLLQAGGVYTSPDGESDVPLIGPSMPGDSPHHMTRHTCPVGLPNGGNILAQFAKNLRLMKRNKGFLLFQFMLPIVQIVLFCVCIGNNPFNLHMAIINQDKGLQLLDMNLGRDFVNALDNHTIIKENYTGSGYGAAVQRVKDGRAWGIIMVGENFTTDLMQRSQGGNVSDAVINGSSIKIQMDATNEQVALIIVQKITEAFQVFSSQMLQEMGYNPKLANLPIAIQQPIYGSADATFTDFMAPGVIISITFFLATGLTTLVFVMDKKSGMLDRCLASGMVSFEIMLAHMFTQMLIVMVQVTLLLLFLLLVFQVPCKGPLIWVVFLVLIQGFCGMSLGVLYSAFCADENSAIQMALGSFFPLLLLSGIIWPVEAIPMWLRYVSYCSPLTYACEAMRCILARGLDITFYAVWRGYLVSSAWCIGLVILGGLIMRLKE